MTPEIVVGALVKWTKGDGYGVVRVIQANRIEVDWDEPGAPTLFTRAGAPLERVALPVQVRRRSNEHPGFLGEAVPDSTPPRWKVTLLTSQGMRVLVVPEADLRPDHLLDPAGRMANGEIGTARQFDLQLVTRHYRVEHLHNDLVSLGDARVDVKPHQVAVVHRVVTNYPHRFLLCDEVGLGKTIEAGMILKELRARDQAQRTLIVVPPNLLRQWQFELKTKFNEIFSILNTSTVKYLETQGRVGNPFVEFDSVLVSADWLSNPKWAKQAAQVDWDMVIVDEAHHARLRRWGNRVETTRLYEVVKTLAAPQHFANRALLFLTATPMQLESHELYSLVELLDPALFPSEGHFENHRKEVPGLTQLVENLRTHGFPLPDADESDTIERVAHWLDIDEDLVAKRLRHPEDLDVVCEELSSRHLLSEVLIRNRKAIVGGFMPRRAHRWEVELTPAERHALEAVEDYVQNGFNLSSRMKDNSVGFVMVIFQKLMASSIWALRQSLAGRRDRLMAKAVQTSLSAGEMKTRLDDDEAAAHLAAAGAGAAYATEARDIAELVTLLDGVAVDSKAEALLENVRLLFEDDPNNKILIFTEFRETQNYLQRRMEERGWNVHVFHGQLRPIEKDASVERFRTSAGPQVLVSTEAGGEGRNFQFCHILVNYDLPWNPMRVEQRIGRVDRIGQEHIVHIFNLWVKGTIEERVLNVLERRINVFEQTVGGLDPILGDTEKDLRKVLQLASEDRDRALTRLEDQIEKHVKAARQADNRLRDFIMDTKSFRKEIAERIVGETSPITADDQEKFIKALLADVKTYIKREGDEYQLSFHPDFATDHPHFFVEGFKKRAVFRADERKDTEHVEYFAFGHPIVETLVERVLDDRYPGTTGTRRLPATAHLQPTSGWLFVHSLSIPGPRPVERLKPIFVDDAGVASEAVGQALLRRATWFMKDDGGADIPAERIPLEAAQEAQAIAETLVQEAASRYQEEVQTEADLRADREHEKIEAYFTYRAKAAADRVANTANTVRRFEESDDPNLNRVVNMWRANLERDEQLVHELTADQARQLARVEQLRHPVVDWTLDSVARIEIVPAVA